MGGGNRADRTPPSRPGRLLSAALDRGSYLWWESARDDRGVAGYSVWRDGRRIGRTRGTSFEDPKKASGRHVYAVRAFDAAGNRSKPAVLKVTTLQRESTGLLPWVCTQPGILFRTC